MTPLPGQPAPPFTLPRDGGGTVSLADHLGRAVALFVYPGDLTTGCTAEAQDFSAFLPRFAAAGTVVLGLSSGGVGAKERFRHKAGLSVPLLADETGEVLRAYNVRREKTTFGRTYMGIHRTTFLIDPLGHIAQVWAVTRVKGHAEQVLAAAERLRAAP